MGDNTELMTKVRFRISNNLYISCTEGSGLFYHAVNNNG